MHAERQAVGGQERGLKGITSVMPRLRSLIFGAHERDLTQRSALVAFLVRVASAGLLYLSQIVLARWMGASEYGIYVLVWTWVLVLGGLSTLGFSTLMMRRLPEYFERGEHDLVRGLLRLGVWLVAGVGTAVTLTAMAILWWFGERAASPYTWPVLLTLACLPLVALSDLMDGIGRARGLIVAALVPPYVLRPLLILLVMALAYVGGLAMTAVTAAVAVVVATWIAAIAQAALLWRELAREIPAGGRTYVPKEWLAMALPFLGAYAAELLLQNTDVLVVSRYLSPADVGIYFAAAKTMSLMLFVQFAVASSVVKRLSALAARGDHVALSTLVQEAVAWTFWPSLVIAVLLLVLGKPLLWLFGPNFVDAYPVMAILAVGFLVRAATGPSEMLLNMLGQHRAAAIVLALAALLNVALALLLVPRFGLPGGAVATALSLVALSLANAVIAKRRLGLWIVIGSRASGFGS